MATQFAVDLVFKSQTKQLNDLQRKLNQLELNLRKLNQGKPFKPIEDGAEGAGRKVDKLKQRLGGLQGALASLGAGLALKASIGGAGQLAQTQLRLEALSEEYGEFGRIQKLVASNAKTFNQSQRESAEGFADVYARLRPLGIELDQIQTTYEGFNAVAIANGASAQAASAAFLQLSQALGSGRLQGDEFRSIAEQVPGILRLVADEMGVTVGELKQLGAEGKLTSDILIRSLAKGFDLNKDKIAKLLALSPAQKFKSFENAVSDLSNAVGKELLPAVIPMVKFLTEALRLFGKLPGPVKTLAAAVFGLAAAFVALAPAIKAVAGLLAGITGAGLLAAGPWIALAAGVGAVAIAAIDGTNKVRKFNDLVGTVGKDRAGITSRISEIEGRIESLGEKAQKGGRRALLAKKQIKELQGALANNKAALAALPPEKKPTIPTPDLPTPDPDKGGGKSGKSAADVAKEQLKAYTDLSREFTRQRDLLYARNDLERELLQIKYDQQDRQAQIDELMDAGQKKTLSLLNTDIARTQELQAQVTAYYQQADAAGILSAKLNEFSGSTGLNPFAEGLDLGGQNKMQLEIQQMEEGLKQLLNPINQVKLAATTIGDAFGASFKSVLDGTKTAQEAISDFFKSIADALFQYAAQAIAQYIAIGIARLFAGVGGGGGGIPGADGFGAAAQNLNLGSSFYGVSAPNLFAEGGYVTGPTNAVIGEGGESEYVIPASKMGTALSRYQAGKRGESVVEGGPGGTGAGEGGAVTVDYTGPVLNFNGDDYLPKSAVPEIITAAARKGAEGGYIKTMGSMRNSRATRARLGMG